MTETFYRTGNYKPDHTTFAGELTSFDFEGHYTLENMASKIAKTFIFDKQCAKNIELRNSIKKVRN